MGFSWVGSMAATPEACFPWRSVLLDGNTSLSPLPPGWRVRGEVIIVLIFWLSRCVRAVGCFFPEACEEGT